MNERLKEVRSEVGLNQTDFAKSIGIGLSTLGMLEIGKRNILDRHIKMICSIHNINEDWFRTGKGSMRVQSPTFSLDEQAKKSNLTELEIAIMRGYMELDHDTRNKIVSKLEDVIIQRQKTIDPIEAELESYRRELEDEKKGIILSASAEQKEKYNA